MLGSSFHEYLVRFKLREKRRTRPDMFDSIESLDKRSIGEYICIYTSCGSPECCLDYKGASGLLPNRFLFSRRYHNSLYQHVYRCGDSDHHLPSTGLIRILSYHIE
uniref:Uncharacterized protein n=1 Tax=Trypanosoma congolense (strain IL3000) TaxID=1068625 RepID=G0ULN8_TRYCI|nr:hypothetical protein, unlikely [Trypanosoma congolense IL3000]